RNPGTVSSDVHAILSGTGAHSSYTINLGATHVSRDKFDSTTGFNGDATLLHELTGRSSLRFYLASRLTNTSNNLLDSQANPDNGSFGGEQISSDVIRDNRVTVVYRRTDSRLNTSISGQVQVIDYEESPNDRKFYELFADLSYKVAPSLDTGLKVVYTYLNQDGTDRTDKKYSITGKVSYHLSRKLRTEFAVRYQDRSSDLKTDEYTEAAVFVGLIWGLGSVPRTGIM
ncbi:MAG: outer membrane beta-barrel protein, partial [Gammaproteobacteria bacterium]